MKVNFTDMDVSGASGLSGTLTLTAALKEVQGDLANVYEIHLWNYCNSSKTNDTIMQCSPRTAGFTFDFIDTWGLNTTAAASQASGDDSNVVDQFKDKTEALENNLLGGAARKALQAYRKVGKAMFYLYAISFWATLATIVAALFAVCSRWGSLITWILAFASSVINTAAVVLSTGIYVALVEGLKGVLNDYDIHVNIGTTALVVAWLSVVFGWAATLFWLFSVCCCSGSSNPHHRGNKGGLWKAEPKGQGYGNYNGRRSLAVSQTGGYSRMSSPFLGHVENEHGDTVPLNSYPQQQTGYTNNHGGAYEPFRHS